MFTKRALAVFTALVLCFTGFGPPGAFAKDDSSSAGTAVTTNGSDRSVHVMAVGEKNLALRRAAWHSSAANYENTAHLTTDGIIDRKDFDSSWVSKTGTNEWVYVDLGAASEISGVTVHWGAAYAKDYVIQLSSDGNNWADAVSAKGAANAAISSDFTKSGIQFVKVLCKESSAASFTIKEIEVFGSNDVEYAIDPLPAPEADGKQKLTGGNWRVQRASEVTVNGTALSLGGYDDSSWLPACVPGTVLVSYLKAGAIPDPNYDDWQFQVSDSFFTADFWYRDSFNIPLTQQGKKVFLNFNAINWKADVYFNGHKLPNSIPGKTKSIEGSFIRGNFDVTDYVNFGAANYLAVYIYKNDTPGNISIQGLAEGPLPNGGALGADNPTMHAAVGWDWLPTIRGRDIGIYEDVFISYSGGVELHDPWIETDLNITPKSAEVSASNLGTGKTIDPLPGQSAADLANILDDNPATEWVGANSDGIGFIIDLGAPITVGSVNINWGEVVGAAAYETQYAKKFSLESSLDGTNWQPFDYYPGGTFWTLPVPPSPGTAEFTGTNISNAINGPSGYIEFFPGFGFPVPAPTAIRYLRYTTLERMTSVLSGSGTLPAKIQDIQIYAEDANTVGQSMIRTYDLDASKAELTFRTEVKNSTGAQATAVVSGVINPGNIPFSQSVTLAPGELKTVEIGGIVINNPDLWWPNTYGDQPLYDAAVQVSLNGQKSDAKNFKFGVREFTYPTDGNVLTLFCNGTRIVAKGGNWGMDDGLKLDTPEIYDTKVRLTKEENLVMIRNWVGMTNHEAFYEACDKYGLLVWDDFWLANPVDGPNPNDEAMFEENAIDKIKRNRYHAALAVYCGRNESSPPAAIDAYLNTDTEAYDGTRFYFPNSAGAPVGSGGGYSLRDPRTYFNDVTGPTLRSETGIPNVPNMESIQKFLTKENQWPISEAWALHDWTFYMNGPANTYVAALKNYKDGAFDVVANPGQSWGQNPDPANPGFQAYKASILKMLKEMGEAYTLNDFSRMAQMINYENHRGLFEGLTVRRSNGFLMWMSQSSWPSFMWQTYDYYLDINGGYFGVKAANQPTHAVMDPRDNRIVLSNLTPKDYADVKTTATIYSLNGTVVSTKVYDTDSLPSDTYGLVLDTLDYTASPTDVVFVKLVVKDSAGKTLGENLYWFNRAVYQDYRALDTLAYMKLKSSISAKSVLANGNDQYSVTLTNDTNVPALQARIRVTAAESGADVLPVFYGDNYISLMPGDSKTVTVEFDPAYLNGEAPRFGLDGWNVTATSAYSPSSAPTITTTTLPNGTVGAAYNQTLAATGAPVTWSAVGLPTGLTIGMTTGVISGTPTTAGNTTFTVKASNVVGEITKSFSITISPASSVPTKPAITTTGLPNGTVGTAYNQALAATGTTPVTWSAVGLPAGLSIGMATGVISGTPTSAGSFTVTVKASNVAGEVTKSFSITISPAATGPIGPGPSGPSGGSSSGTGSIPGGSPGSSPASSQGSSTSTSPSVTQPSGSTNTQGGFTDAVSISGWAKAYIDRLVQEGVLSGYSDGSLKPAGNVTRAEFTKMITTALKLSGGGATKTFSDVGAGDWFKQYVDIASSLGIINGVSDTAFAPNVNISRQDLSTIVYRAITGLGLTIPSYTGVPFPDDAQIAAYAKDAVYGLKQIGVISGRDTGAFDPGAFATREETAKIICEVEDFIQKASAASTADAASSSEAASTADTASIGGETETEDGATSGSAIQSA